MPGQREQGNPMASSSSGRPRGMMNRVSSRFSVHSQTRESESPTLLQAASNIEARRQSELKSSIPQTLREHGIRTRIPTTTVPEQQKCDNKLRKYLYMETWGESDISEDLSCDIVFVHLHGQRSEGDQFFSVFHSKRVPESTSLPRREGSESAKEQRSTFDDSTAETPELKVPNLPPQQDGSKQQDADDKGSDDLPICWLTDENMLRKALPFSRIISFGWDVSSQIKEKTIIDIESVAFLALDDLLQKRAERKGSRPTIFIGHGYGNVIIEKMLFEKPATENQQHTQARNKLVGSTVAIILFAAPFESLDNLIEWVKKLGPIEDKTLSNPVVLPQIWKTFFDGAEEHNISTFGFLEGSNRAKGTNDNANRKIGDTLKRLDRQWLRKEGVDEIAKISTPNDERFKNVRDAIFQSVASHRLLQVGNVSANKIQKLIDRLRKMTFEFDFDNRKGQTVLHVAATKSELDELVGCLARSRVLNLDRQDREGNTALHLAVECNKNPKVVEHLLKHGADPRIKNDLKESAYDLAMSDDNDILPQIANLFKHPPLVEGPSKRKDLVWGSPRTEDAKKACKGTGMIVREIFGAKNDGTPDRHRRYYTTIQKLIYGDLSTEDMFKTSDGTDPEKTLCHWYHIPMNNMYWVQDLFAKLNAKVWPWPSSYRQSEFPHGRYMAPEAARLQRLDNISGHGSEEDWVVFMPYFSYEKSENHQTLSKLVSKITYPNHLVQNPPMDFERTLRDLSRLIEEIREELERGTEKEDQEEEGHENDTVEEEERNRNGIQLDDGIDGDTSKEEEEEIEKTVQEKDEEEVDEEDETDDNSQVDSAEALAIKGYLNDWSHDEDADLIFHIRRTLDQSYYYMLKDTSYRDKSQVVSRWAKKKWPHKADHNIIMVDQLWLWFLKGDDKRPGTIITSFPSRKGADSEPYNQGDDLEGMVLNDIDRRPISKSKDLVSRILSVCCNAFNPHEHRESINFLQAFESSIGNTEEEESRLFRTFRERAKTLHALHDRHRLYLQDRSMLLKKLLDIRQESRILKEIKDIVDEIKMIKSVLGHQVEVVRMVQELTSKKPIVGEPCNVQENDGEDFTGVLTLLGNTKRRIEVMESHAKEVEIQLERLLELKQKQANLWEARFARESAEVAAEQGNTVLVFTIVTIIFLPLSFMTSFFALGISIFPKEEGENNFELKWISGIIFGISFAVIFLLVVIALKIEIFVRIWSQLKYWAIKYVVVKVIHPRHARNKVRSCRIEKRLERWHKSAVKYLIEYDLPHEPEKEVKDMLYTKLEAKEEKDSDTDKEESSDTEEDCTDDEKEKTLKDRQKVRQEALLCYLKDS